MRPVKRQLSKMEVYWGKGEDRMELLELISKAKLQKIQDLFSTATGVAATMIDKEGNSVTEPSNFTDFCMKYTRGTELGLSDIASAARF